MKKTRLLVIALALVMFFSACAPGAAPAAPAAPGAATDPAGTAPGGAEAVAGGGLLTLEQSGGIVLPIVDEPITLTVFWEADPKAMAVIPSYHDMRIFHEMERFTNISLDFMHPPAGQTEQQFSLMLATNSLPDLVWFNWTRVPGGVMDLLGEGTLLRLNDFLDAGYLPNMARLFDERPINRKQGTLPDGTFFSFPKIRNDGRTVVTTGLQIRYDWMQSVGITQVPETIAEWEVLLTAFRDNRGNGVIPVDSFPFGGRSDNPNLIPIDAFSNAWYLIYNDFAMRDNGTRVIYGPLLPEYRDFVETMRRWYAEGLLDPDYLATDNASFEAKIINGHLGAYHGTVNGNMGRFKDIRRDAGDYTFDLIPLPNAISHLPEAGGRRFGRHVQSYMSADGMAITNNNRFPLESAIFLDLFYSPELIIKTNYGIEGESFIWEEGNDFPTFTDIVMNHPTEPLINAIHIYNFAISQGPMIQLTEMFLQTAHHTRMQEAYVEWTRDTTQINLFNLVPFDEEGAILARIMSEARTLTEERVNRMIMGVDSMDAFDDYVQLLRDMGVEEAVAIMQGMLDRFNAG